MNERIINALSDPQWKGYDYKELKFGAMVARTKLEIGKAELAGQFVQMSSSDNAGNQMMSKIGDYIRYASYAMRAYRLGKSIWNKFKSK